MPLTVHRRLCTCAMALVVLAFMTNHPHALQDQREDRSDAIHPLFDLGVPKTAPFPNDWFTVPDHSQITRRRVNLPLPDCSAQASDCEDLAVINTLDGFNLEPQFSIPFDGAQRRFRRSNRYAENRVSAFF